MKGIKEFRATDAAENSRPRVLAVDDDRVMRAVIDKVLSQAGMEVVAVEVDDAIHLLGGDPFDLVVCDRTMPGISGQQFLEIVRSDPRFDFTPFLFLTVSEELDDLVAGLGAGADDYITKPFHPAELVARVTGRLERADLVKRRDRALVDIETFAFECDREITRAARGGAGGVVAIVNIPSLKAVEDSLGDRERRRVLETIAAVMAQSSEPLDMIGASHHGDLGIMMPDISVRDAADRLREMATRAASMVTQAQGLSIRPVTMIGFVEFESQSDIPTETIVARATQAAAEAERIQDLQPRKWIPADEQEGEKSDHHPFREVLQTFSTFLLGIFMPFLLYLALNGIGIDVSWVVYLAVVVVLVSTAALIWLEGIYASRHPGAPVVAGAPEPPASAIICAYMPNEAATIVETIECFLEVDYPAGLQIVLAYNTPHYIPVEAELQAIANANPNLLLLKVEHSNSKAQNLNAALARTTGDFIGVFDADHHPDPDSFHRAWRWLSNGYDVVQGHCLVRNPEETFLAKMVAVEFESIYSVAHPGRWLRDGFGIFGGSNGYWKTESLHMTRMRGSMLTEDIDASMRVLVAGGQIASDPGLISRELATTTAKQIWNQRLRWAQGWTQVSVRHIWQMLRLPHFSLRQKFGVFMLLLQREIYPWVSLQIFPLLAFWWVRGDLVDWFIPIFLVATIFTTSVGPGTVFMTYRLSHPSIKRRAWFWQYGVFSTLMYTEAKNVIARVGHLKEIMGESSWRVTPRSADPGSAALPLAAGAPMFEPSNDDHGDPADVEPSALVPASAKASQTRTSTIDMLAHTRRTTGSCLWCGETRSIAVETCSRCSHGWIDRTLDHAATPGFAAAAVEAEVHGEEDSSPHRRKLATVGLAVVATIGFAALYTSGIRAPQSPPATTVVTTIDTTPPAVAAPTPTSATPPTTIVVPSTTQAPQPAVPATTIPAPTTLAPATTTTSTTTMPPALVVASLNPDSISLGAFSLGPVRFGTSGPSAAAELVSLIGQPNARVQANEEAGLCSADTGRVLQWAGLSVILRQDDDGEVFVGYRYDGLGDVSDSLATISGLTLHMTIADAQSRYPSSIVTTSTLPDGSPIFLLLRSSDRRTLLWGPISADEAPTIMGIYSYRVCDRGPFSG
ncbi:MAG: glycosyltransferase [bacterium]|nr:glycosyltransferase [bacterium]